MFSFVLFLLHRHVLGRSLEHPHARIHGSGFPVLITLDLWHQAQHQHQHAAPHHHQHAAPPQHQHAPSRSPFLLRPQAAWLTPFCLSRYRSSFCPPPVRILVHSSYTAPPLVRTLGRHRLYSGALRASRHACKVLTALRSPPLSHSVRGFLSLLHHFFAAIIPALCLLLNQCSCRLITNGRYNFSRLIWRTCRLITNGRYNFSRLIWRCFTSPNEGRCFCVETFQSRDAVLPPYDQGGVAASLQSFTSRFPLFLSSSCSSSPLRWRSVFALLLSAAGGRGGQDRHSVSFLLQCLGCCSF